MAEPKRFDINKIENFLKNSADKTQTLSYWNAAVEHGKTVKEIDENLASNGDDKQIADLLLGRTYAKNKRDRFIKAVENAIKVKYQPQRYRVQRATAQPEVKFASSKPSMTLSADPNRLPPTFGGIQSGAFQVPQLANTQKQYLPGQGANVASNVGDDYFIRSSLPKLKLAEFSGDPLEWPEWSQLFQATVYAANIDVSEKMNHLKTMVTGRAKEASAGLGYTAEMYNVAWNVLVRNFGKPQMVVNAQLKRIYCFLR